MERRSHLRRDDALLRLADTMYIRFRNCLGAYVPALVGCLTLTISGCMSSNYSARGGQSAAAAPGQIQPIAPAQSKLDTTPSVQPPAMQQPQASVEDDSSAELDTLWRERTAPSAEASNSGFTLGPGDVLKISVPMISQLTDRKVRVSEDDTIALPLLGEIKVAGMTEQDLRQQLISRLGHYMYHPQVEVYLQTPENRVVSVLGTVKAPGRYLVASRSDTVMTLLSRAGGTTEMAGSQILLFPAPSASSYQSRRTALADASATPALYQAGKHDGMSGDQVSDAKFASAEAETLTGNKQGAPLVISTAGPGRYLDMPVRPGDVLFVPAAGSVSVQGWVDKPGLFPITPGMTALGSIAAAGGALFTSSATLVRAEPGGGRKEIALDIPKIKRGQEPDVPVQGGDVIIVERSVAGAVPYSLYFIINKIGLGVPIVP